METYLITPRTSVLVPFTARGEVNPILIQYDPAVWFVVNSTEYRWATKRLTPTTGYGSSKVPSASIMVKG